MHGVVFCPNPCLSVLVLGELLQKLYGACSMHPHALWKTGACKWFISQTRNAAWNKDGFSPCNQRTKTTHLLPANVARQQITASTTVTCNLLFQVLRGGNRCLSQGARPNLGFLKFSSFLPSLVAVWSRVCSRLTSVNSKGLTCQCNQWSKYCWHSWCNQWSKHHWHSWTQHCQIDPSISELATWLATVLRG